MQTQTQVPPALQVLMSMGAQPTAPGPMGQPIPTIASQKAEQESQGLQALMPGAAVQANRMAQAMQPVTQGQLQQVMQQQSQQSPGISGLPAPNMQRMAEGGVVGYSGEGPSFVNLSDAEIERLSPDQRKAYYKEMLSRRNAPIPTPSAPSMPTVQPRTGLGIAGAMARKLGPIALLSELFGTSDEDIATLEKAEQERKARPVESDARPRGQQNYGPGDLAIGNAPPMSPEAQAMLRRQLPDTGVVMPRPPVSRPETPTRNAATVAAPATGIATALPSVPTLDKSGIATAGDAIAKAAAERESRMRGILAEREKAASGMADLNAEGIAALQEANRVRQELLAKQRGDDKFNRQMALLRGFQGDRAAYDRAVAGQQARDEAANQAQLMHQQAVLKLREAQQAKQLGQFDRALAFEQQAADLEGKARASSLEAQRIAASLATSEYTGLVNLREQDIRMQEGAANRANAIELERMRRATADRPGETERIFNRFNELKAKDPAAAEQYLQSIERIKGLGRGVTERQDLSELKTLQANLQKQVENILLPKPQRDAAAVQLEQVNARISQMAGLGGAPAAGPSAAPAVGTIMQGYRFKGGNPADKNNWEKV